MNRRFVLLIDGDEALLSSEREPARWTADAAEAEAWINPDNEPQRGYFPRHSVMILEPDGTVRELNSVVGYRVGLDGEVTRRA